VQRGLRDHSQGVRLLLTHTRRLSLGVGDAGLGVHPVAGGVERPAEHRAHLGRQAAPDHDHAVFILIQVQRPALLPLGRLAIFGMAVHPTPGADEMLDVGRGTGLGELQQALLALRRRDPGEGPDFGVRQLPTGEGMRDPGGDRGALARRGRADGPRRDRARRDSSASGRTIESRWPSRRGRRSRRIIFSRRAVAASIWADSSAISSPSCSSSWISGVSVSWIGMRGPPSVEKFYGPISEGPGGRATRRGR
jgi:hypothetical protein